MDIAQVLNSMKQIIIVNSALELPEEKRAIQMARASAGAFLEADKDARKTWLQEGKPQVVLDACDEQDLRDLLSKARRRSLPICLVENASDQAASDAQAFACLGIGPASDFQIDQLTEVFNYYRWLRENVSNQRF